MKIDKVQFVNNGHVATTLKDGVVRRMLGYRTPLSSGLDSESVSEQKKYITTYTDPSGGKFTDFSTALHHALFLNDKGEVFGVGESKYGRMLGSTHVEYDTPTKLKTPDNEKVVKVFAIANNSFILTEKGNMYGTGANGENQLGLPGKSERSKWVKINSEGVNFVDATRDETNSTDTKFYAKTDKGEFYSWGKYKTPFKVVFPPEVRDNINKVIPREHTAYALSVDHVYALRNIGDSQHTHSFTMNIADPTDVRNLQGTSGNVFITTKHNIRIWNGSYNPQNVTPPVLKLSEKLGALAENDVDSLPQSIIGSASYDIDMGKGMQNTVYIQAGEGVYALENYVPRNTMSNKYEFAASATKSIMSASGSSLLEQPTEYIASFVDCKAK